MDLLHLGRRDGRAPAAACRGGLGKLGVDCYREVLPKLGLDVSQKRITPRSGSTSETPTRCHSCCSPASRASWICSLTLPLWSSISSWAKNRPWCCSVTSLPSIGQPPEVSYRASQHSWFDRVAQSTSTTDPQSASSMKTSSSSTIIKDLRGVASMPLQPEFGAKISVEN